MSSKRAMKNYEELRFSDDFMFGKVMEDPELCREVLECLLQEPVGELKEVQTQREFRFTVDGKPIRLDVYNEDSRGAIYDAEMENLNRKTVDSHQLPKRSREGNDLPEELKKFYDCIEKDRVDSELTRKIEDAVDKGRQKAIGSFADRRSFEAAQSRGWLPRSKIGGRYGGHSI